MQPRLPSSTPVAAVDLEIRVSTPWGDGGQRLDYVVHSPSGVAGFHQERVPGDSLHSPESFQKQLLNHLESLDRGREAGKPLEPGEILREVTSHGHDLYQALFPRPLRAIYRELAGRVRTLLLTSDEPWIPWEIVRPCEFDDDDFLCMRFEMSRWLTGDVPLAFEKQLRQMLVVQAGDGEDDDPEGEGRVLRELAERTPGLEATPRRHVGFREAVDLLEGGHFDLIHFVGHGVHDHRRPAESRIELPDRLLRARHLSPEAEKRLRPRRPVVFFNSCQVGRLSSSLTSVDGWAQRWVRRCGCSVFLAPILSVDDTRAARFAELVYQRLYAGQSLGAAVLQARHDLRREEPGDLTWLAYSLYGAPNARILFGDHRSAAPTAVPVAPTGSETAAAAAGSSVHQAPRAAATTRAFGRRSPAGAGRVPGRAGRRLVPKVLGAAASLAVVLALALRFTGTMEDGTAPGERDGGEVERPAVVEPGAGNGTTEPEPAPATERRRSQPSPPFPLEAPLPGKVGIIVLDRQTGRTDEAVAAAVRTTLVSLGAGLQPFVARLDAGEAERLVQGDLSVLPGDGRTPWGAQYLLLAAATRKRLPQAAVGQEGLALTLDAQLVAAGDGSTAARTTETHTGISVTEDGALAQAAERCLKPITNTLTTLTGGDGHDQTR